MKITDNDVAIFKALVQTVLGALILIVVLYHYAVHEGGLGSHELIDLLLTIWGITTGVANVGKLRARNGSN